MSRDLFLQLRSYLRVVNNLEKPENCVDKLYKVRPLIDVIRRCLELRLEEELCVDEQIVPFTGTFAIKQYVKGKPGLNENNLEKFGQGASVVLHLSERIGTEKGHKLYYDNYFLSYGP
ncbi:hypothetical protein JTB14_026786 [Gonioctena quinquepunctata]|nr:hypothetical protein JTB14_026786 [Gonioctena quinquepunctata]